MTEWMINDIIKGQREIWCRNDNVKSNWYMVPRKERGKNLGLLLGELLCQKWHRQDCPIGGLVGFWLWLGNWGASRRKCLKLAQVASM